MYSKNIKWDKKGNFTTKDLIIKIKNIYISNYVATIFIKQKL